MFERTFFVGNCHRKRDYSCVIKFSRPTNLIVRFLLKQHQCLWFKISELVCINVTLLITLFIWYMYYFWYYRNRLCHHCHWYSSIYCVYILDQQTQGLQQIYRYVHCCTNLCPIQSIGNRIDYMYILKQGIERWKTLNTCFCNEQKKLVLIWFWENYS